MKNRHKKKLEVILGSESMKINDIFKEELKHKLFKENKMATNNKKLGSFVHNLTNHKLVPLSAALVAALVVGGVSIYVTRGQEQQARENEISLPSDLTDVISIEEVKSLALKDTDGSDIVGVELEQEDGVLYYKVKFADGTFRLYNAKTGEFVINTDGVEVDETVPADFVPSVTLDQAVNTAKQSRPGVQVEKVELEVEDGVVVYSVRFVDESRVDVNATDGTVVRVKVEDEEDKEDESSDEDENESDDSSESESDDNGGSDDGDNESETDDSDSNSDDDNSGSGSDSVDKDDKADDSDN